MKTINRALLLAVFLASLAIVSQAQSGWAGTYVFEEDGGKTAGGTAIFITHELNIIESDDGLRATLKSNGYQTSVDIVGHAKAIGNKLEIYFESYGEDNVFESHEIGDLLLTLEQTTVKGKNELLTWWGKFTPIVPEKPKTGKPFFTRVKATNVLNPTL